MIFLQQECLNLAFSRGVCKANRTIYTLDEVSPIRMTTGNNLKKVLIIAFLLYFLLLKGCFYFVNSNLVQDSNSKRKVYLIILSCIYV